MSGAQLGLLRWFSSALRLLQAKSGSAIFGSKTFRKLSGSTPIPAFPANCVTLNGSASCVQSPGSPVAVQWTQLSGPAGRYVFQSDPACDPSVLSVGRYLRRAINGNRNRNRAVLVRASDDHCRSASSACGECGCEPGCVNSTVQLDGTASFDPETGNYYVSSVTLPYAAKLLKSSVPSVDYLREMTPVETMQGVPLWKPHYGRITPIDLNTGEHRWMT